MMMLQTWYDLSDMGVEDMVHDTCLSDAFCGLRLEDTAPDHRTLSRFRSELSEKRALYRLPAKFNAPLAQHGSWVQQDYIIDVLLLRKDLNVYSEPVPTWPYICSYS
jgi:transposase, IS5 family